MATGPITKSNVDALVCPPDKDREILWDGGHREAVRGFGVAAFRNGGKCYIAQYRKDGRSRRTRIGEHRRLTPEEARRQAKIVLGLVERADPIEERRKERASTHVSKVAKDWFRLHVKAKRKERTAEEYERRPDSHIFRRSGLGASWMCGARTLPKLHAQTLRDSPIKRTGRWRRFRRSGIGRLGAKRLFSRQSGSRH